MDDVAGTFLTYAQVVIDLPTRALSEPFEYGVGAELTDVDVGTPVVVPLGSAVAVGYIVDLSAQATVDGVRPIIDVLGSPLFDRDAIDVATWIAEEY
ncbi:MAG: primosomal protein N', partial [Coriobacteriia bacterium]|nr:primosomal protein N' [Coriobacteriia bacterium]